MTYHKKISFIKSAIRVIGYGALFTDVRFGAVILALAEVLGILEEVKEK